MVDIGQMLGELDRFTAYNRSKLARYEARNHTQLGASVPREMTFLASPIDWARIVVDVLDERMNFTTTGSAQYDDALQDLGVFTKQHPLHLESFIHGVNFAVITPAVGAGTKTVFEVVSPLRMTAWHGVRGEFLRAIRRVDDTHVILYEPDTITEFENRGGGNGAWRPVRAQQGVKAKLNGQPPVIPFVNMPRPGRELGTSELTPAICGMCDQAVRTLACMESNREFNSGRHFAILGVDPDKIHGKFRPGLDGIWAMDRDEGGNLPSIEEFRPTSPMPYVEQMNLLAQQVAAAGAIPVSYLGVSTANPTSAEAINASEVRLVRRALRRQAAFTKPWQQVVTALTGEENPRIVWEDPATPTLAATADAVSKLVGSQIIPAGSDVVFDLLHMTPAEKSNVVELQAREAAEARLFAKLTAAAESEGAAGDPA